MKSLPGRDLCRLLERHERGLRRVTGSHHIYAKEGRRERLSVPVHGSAILKAGLLRHLLKVAGIDEAEL